MDSQMKLADFEQHFRSRRQAAKALKVSRTTLYSWDENGGDIPYPWDIAAAQILDDMAATESPKNNG